MAETRRSGESRRIILRVDVQSNLPLTLELAAALAVAEQAALHGLFVEDEDLLNVAGLPFSQEITRLGGQARQLDDQKLQRTLNRFGGEFRRILESQCDRLALAWSYSTVRGRRLALELGEAVDADILVIAQPRSRRSHHVHGPLHVLFCPDHSVLALPALRVILDRNSDRAIELLLLGGGDDSAPTRSPELMELLAEYPMVQAACFPATGLDELLQGREYNLDCIVASRGLDAEQGRQIASLASCPIIIVS